jgi:hypothetical protein
MSPVLSKDDSEGRIYPLLTSSSQSTTVPTTTITQSGDEEVLTELRECWNRLLAKPADKSTWKWRWRWDEDDAKPVRFRPPIGKQPYVECKNDRWYLIEEKKDKEIIDDLTVPERVLADWKRRANLNPEEWEGVFLANKTGINRVCLRQLIKILKAASIAPLPKVEGFEPVPRLAPVQTIQRYIDKVQTRPAQDGSITLITDNELGLPTTTLATKDEVHYYWESGLDVSKSWRSKERPLPLVSAEERVKIQEAIQVIKSGKQMVFITGAGISVAAKSSVPLILAILEQKADNAIQSQLSDRRMGC